MTQDNQRLGALRMVLTSLALAAVLGAQAQNKTNIGALRQIADFERAKALQEKSEAVNFARVFGLPIRQENKDGSLIEIVRVEKGKPVYMKTENGNAAISVRATPLYPGGAAGLSLTGTGITLHEWDGGTVWTGHQEFTNGRVVNGDGGGTHWHATHVGGTMVGAGANATVRGMSYAANLRSFDWNSDASEMATEAAAGARASNHSYGGITGWYHNGAEWYWYGWTPFSTTEDYGFGYYNNSSATWDNIAYNAPYYLICKSAGNDRGEGPASGTSHKVYSTATNGWVTSTDTRDKDGGATGYDTIPYNGVAKNILTVGAVDDVLNYSDSTSVVMSSFSGWGPTDDGRIKPDIVGNGVGVVSAYEPGGVSSYAGASGTSMSTPNVTGAIGLILQHWENVFPARNDMWSSTVKGLLIHTADEAGSHPGPDYAFGWGLMDTRAAVEQISKEAVNDTAITEGTLSQTGNASHTYSILSDGSPMRVTLCWTDRPATVASAALDNSASRLVNDLQLRLVKGGTISFPFPTYTYPYVLDPANPADAATTGDNFRDNVEQVYLAAPAGVYQIEVSCRNTIVSGSQTYSLLIDGASNFSSASFLSLSLSTNTVYGGDSLTGNVHLDNYTPSDKSIAVSDNSGSIVTPATATVGQGAHTGTFTITTTAVAATATRQITATADTVTDTENLTLKPALKLNSLTLDPSTIESGESGTGTVTMNTSPISNTSVALSDNTSAIGTPASVDVTSASASNTFAFTTTATTTTYTRTVFATYNGVTKSASLTLTPRVMLSSLVLAASSVEGGMSTTATVNLTVAPGVDAEIAVSDNSSVITTPATATVTAGTTSKEFTVDTARVTSTATRQVTVGYRGGTKTASLTVLASVTPSSLALDPPSVQGGDSVMATLTMSRAAHAGGAEVTVSDNSGAITTPPSVSVDAGETGTTFTVFTSPVSVTATRQVTVSRLGVTRTASLVLTPTGG